ncbi:MAG: hypothetical protein QOH08_2477 [Chloroflexota bacterium]|nr:hypothetical protein [Chloroflexota bacterium]
MRSQSVAATRPSRPWLAFIAGGAIGFAILLVTQALTETRVAFGPWDLGGNGALAVPFIGFPLAIYGGWTFLADRYDDRDLLIGIASFSTGLILGSFPFGLFFALPMVLITAAVYVTWTRGRSVKRSDRLLWIAFAVSVVLSALPALGLFGAALLPGSLILLAEDKSPGVRIALGSLLVVATVVVVFGVPALLFGASGPAS